MQRDRNEMHARPDTLFSQLAHKGRAVNLQPPQVESNHVQVPGVTAVRLVGRQFDFVQLGEGAVVNTGMRRSAFDKAIEFSKLVNADGSLDVAEIVLETVSDHVIVPIALL